jgi:transposase
LPERGALDGKRIASLAGLAPFTRQSGQWKGKAMIAGGRKAVRSALFLASLAACRHNPVLKAFRQRLIDAGKPKMLAAIAAAANFSPSCGTNSHGAPKPLDRQHSRL